MDLEGGSGPHKHRMGPFFVGNFYPIVIVKR